MDDKRLLKFLNEEKKLKDKDLILIVKRRIRINASDKLILLFSTIIVIILCFKWMPNYLTQIGYSFDLSLIAWMFVSAGYIGFFCSIFFISVLLYYIFDKLVYKKENEILKRMRDNIK